MILSILITTCCDWRTINCKSVISDRLRLNWTAQCHNSNERSPQHWKHERNICRQMSITQCTSKDIVRCQCMCYLTSKCKCKNISPKILKFRTLFLRTVKNIHSYRNKSSYNLSRNISNCFEYKLFLWDLVCHFVASDSNTNYLLKLSQFNGFLFVVD